MPRRAWPSKSPLGCRSCLPHGTLCVTKPSAPSSPKGLPRVIHTFSGPTRKERKSQRSGSTPMTRVPKINRRNHRRLAFAQPPPGSRRSSVPITPKLSETVNRVMALWEREAVLVFCHLSRPEETFDVKSRKRWNFGFARLGPKPSAANRMRWRTSWRPLANNSTVRAIKQKASMVTPCLRSIDSS